MIDFSNFEKKTRGGYDWEVIVPEDGLIRVIIDGDKFYMSIDDCGKIKARLPSGSTLPATTDCALVLRKEEWRAGWRPGPLEDYYLVGNWGVASATWDGGSAGARRAAIGNCYPDTSRGKLLAEARAKYEPLIGEIAGMDEPEEVFKYFRLLSDGLLAAEYPRPDGLEKERFYAHTDDLKAAIRWLDSGYRLTIEEAEQ